MTGATIGGRAGRLLLEGLVVLLSVLAAFMLDGWRIDQEVARDVRQDLDNVHRELLLNRQRLVAHVDALDRIVGGGTSLLQILSAAGSSIVVEAPDTTVWLAVGWTPSLDPSWGALNALIVSGRLGEIESPALRVGLAGLREQMIDGIEEDDSARRITQDQLWPLLRDDLDFEAAGRVFVAHRNAGKEAATVQERLLGVAVPTFGSIAHPNSLQIRNAILTRVNFYFASRDEFGRLLPELDALIDLTAQQVN